MAAARRCRRRCLPIPLHLRHRRRRRQADLSAVDPVAFPQLADLDVSAGGFEGLVDGDGLMVHKDPAKDLDLQVGDTVDGDVPERRRTDAHGVGHLRRRLARLELVHLDRDARVGERPPTPRSVRARQARRRRRPRRRARRDPGRTRRSSRRPRCRATPSSASEQEGQINQLLKLITDLLVAAMLHRRDRHRDHARAVGLRTHAGDRLAAGGRHDPAPAPPSGAVGGGDRVGVRRGRRHRGRYSRSASRCRSRFPRASSTGSRSRTRS